MDYKKIVLEMFQLYPEIETQFPDKRIPLRIINGYAEELERRHRIWIDNHGSAETDRMTRFRSRHAFIFALEDLQKAILQQFRMYSSEPLSEEVVGAFLRRHLPESE